MKSSQSFIQRYFKKLSHWVVLLLILFIGALFLFGYIIHQVLWNKEEAADQRVFDFLAAHVISPDMTVVMKIVTYCASSTFLQIAYVLVVISYLVQKNWKRSIEISVIGLGGFLINYSMKLFFQRPRPSNPLIDPLNNFSFPSGHATSSFIFYGLLIYLIWKSELKTAYKYLFGALLILFALLIGFSRIYLRVHYPSDVVAGFSIGIAWLALSVWMMEKLKKKSDRELKNKSIHEALR